MLRQRMPQRARERVLQQVGRCKVRDGRLLHHGAVLEHGHAVGHVQGQLYVVRDEQHAVSRVGERAEVVERADGQIQVESGRGLVGDDDARIVHERAAQKHAPRHAARQLEGVEPRRLLRQAVALEQPRATAAALGVRHVGAREALHLPPNPHERVQVVHALRHERHAVAAQAREAPRILQLAVEPDATAHGGVRLEQAQHGIGQKRLARPRRAHHRHDLARMHRDA